MNNKYADMFTAGIVDPAKVTRSALQNAASIAAMVLTTQAVITRDSGEERQRNAQRRVSRHEVSKAR